MDTINTRQETDAVTVSRRENVVLLRLNRPRSRNTLSEETLNTLSTIFDDIAATPQVRAVVLASSGPVFCAGHDLKELTTHRADADGGRAYFERIVNLCSTMMQKIIALPQPVIAAVDGIAIAAGCQLVASCDMATAGAYSTFCTPGVNIGLFCSTPMVAMSRNMPRKQAMEMLMLGEMFSAKDARRYGLINRVVTDGQAEVEALKMARVIAEKSPVALKMGKKAFYDQLEMSLPDAYRYVTGVMVENMMSRDAEEGIGAFIEKRPPLWPVED